MRIRLAAAYLLTILIAIPAVAAEAPVWTAPIKSVHQPPALVRDGGRSLVVVASNDGLIALDAQGREAWRSPAIKGSPDALAVVQAADGRSRVFAAVGRTLFALDAAGRLLWKAPLGDDAICAAAAVMPDGSIRVVTGDGSSETRCFQASPERSERDGRLLWSFVFQSGKRPREEDEAYDKQRGFWGDYYRAENVTGIAAQPAPPGVPGVFVVAEFGDVYALDWNGRYVWDHKLPGKTPRSGPVLARLAGKATVLVGCADHHLYALDAQSGKRLWSAPATFGVYTPAVADVDGDGQPEVIYSDEKCLVFCVAANGAAKWQADLSRPLVLAYNGRRTLGPARVFETPQGVRIAIPMRNDRMMPVLDGATGKVAAELQVEPDDIKPAELEGGGPIGTPLVADLGAGPMLIAAGAFTGVKAFPVPGARAVQAPAPLALRPLEVAAESANALAVTAPKGLAVGPNEIVFEVKRFRNPTTLALTIVWPSGAPTYRCDHFANLFTQRVTETFEARAPGQTVIEATLIDQVTGKRVGQWQGAFKTVGLSEAVGPPIRDLEAAARSLRPDNPGAAEFLRRQALRAEPEAAAITPAALKSQSADLLSERAAAVRSELARLSAGAKALLAADAKARAQRVQAWPVADPWERFYPDQLPTQVSAPQTVSVTLAGNEYESAAFNLTNWSGEAISVRLEPEAFGPAGEKSREIDWRDHLALHVAQLVPTSRGYCVADALPPLGDASLLTIAPWQSAQVWLTFRSGELAPGAYAANIAITGVTLERLALTVPLEMRVHKFALPEKKPLRFCNWAYPEQNKWFARCVDDAVRDMVEHYTSVFPEDLRSPTFEYGQTGAIRAPSESEWARLDEIVRRYHPFGIILLQGEPALKYAGAAPEPEGARDQALAAGWRAIVKHLADLGLGYDDWAWYVWDEPGLDRGPSIDQVVKAGKRLREIDPKIRIYTDPVSPNGLPDLERLKPYIDIWQPDQETFAPIANEPKPEFQPEAKAAWFHATGDPIWIYECHPRMKRGHPLNYYRRQAWVCWKFGLAGMGFWTYDTTPDDHWAQIANGNEYALVYPGEKPIPSKRWEACREGIEDYTYLWLLRQAADAAVKRGVTSPDLDRAKRLLADAAPDLIARSMDYDLLMRYRAEIGDLIERLATP